MSNQLHTEIETIIEELSKPPYCIPDTHFKIGAKVHSESFYYAKPLFQNSKYVNVFAEMIVEKIKKDISTEKKILLIGYEMYSKMLLSIVSKTLNSDDSNNIKHFVGIDNDGKFSFKPNEKKDMFWLDGNDELLEQCNAVIIVPIASKGSTAVKIKYAVQEEVRKIVKPILKAKLKKEKETNNELNEQEKFNKELEKRIKEQIDKITFSDKSINVIAAKDTDEKFENIIEKNQEDLISINGVKWHFPNECEYCFGENTRTLFGTDKSSLTPSLIFNNPKGKTITNDKSDKTAISDIDKIIFDNSLKYKRIKRNNEFFLFSINSPQFIEDNRKAIEQWLTNLKKEEVFDPKEKGEIVILAPCHETNSEFLNLINEKVFSNSATIIYHQANVDYIENYKPLNEELLNKADKVFYVDDNLISGAQFFEVYHLFRDTVESLEITEEEVKNVVEQTLFGEEKREVNKKPLTGAILLRDSSTQEMHDRFLRAVNQCRSFVAYNLPPALSFDSKKPLEHERKRFADLRQFALHDVLIKIFDNKEQELNVESDKEEKQSVKESKKEKMFKTTHKVFDYFKDKQEESFEIEDLQKHCYGEEEYNDIENKITLLKVLSQYPFVLYRPLKGKAFDWHNDWLKKPVIEEKYKTFCEFKFLIRRAVFLDNFQIVDTSFLQRLPAVFDFIELELSKCKKDSDEERNLNDFPIFLVRIYLELVQKNGWAAVKLLENIKADDFVKNDFAKRFLRMLKIELSAVVNDFYETITKQYDRGWRDVFNKPEYKDKFIKETKEIQNFIDKEKLKETNKYTISEKVLSKFVNEKFINFLWIKQLIFNDTHPKSYFPANVNYQQKIDAIIEKMISFFPVPNDKDKNVQAFLVVTDTKQNPYVLYDKENILSDFEGDNKQFRPIEEDINKLFKSRNYNETTEKIKIARKITRRTLVKFLNGIDDNNLIAKETTAEYIKNDKIKWRNKSNSKITWTDCYNSNKCVTMDFFNKDTNWLYIIRISELEDSEFTTQGLLGFYSKEDLTQEFLPKQLLMLLRNDISKFITKHNKNDEFSELRITQVAERYAYLAGHGRLTLQRVAEKDDKFIPYVRTIEKLQYILATKYSQDELIKDFEPTTITKEIENELKQLAENIYKTKYIEDEVTDFEVKIITNDFPPFSYNKEIFFCICFELIWNAKKNIFRFLDCKQGLKNKLTVTFEAIKKTTESEEKSIELAITFKSTGTNNFDDDIDDENIRKINNCQQLKGGNKQEGLYFIHSLIKKVSAGSELQVSSSQEIEKCKSCANKDICPVYVNEIKITLKRYEQHTNN